MTAEDKTRLLAEMDSLMRSLRQCDTQATAVSWMARAYNAMDGATRLIGDLERTVREEASERKGLIFHIPKPEIEIVQSMPRTPRANPHEYRAGEKVPNYTRPNGQTVVYPEFFLHPGLRPEVKPWTRADTLRLEAASKMSPRRIVHKGQ